MPRILAKALRAAGVADAAIEEIPDEQQAIDAALRMAKAGDLLLVFGDALTRSWKQIIHFQPEGVAPRRAATTAASAPAEEPAAEPEFNEAHYAELGDVKRDERGIFVSREAED